MVVKLGSSLGEFLGSVLRGVKKSGKLLILSIYWVFRRNSKTAFCIVLASFLGGK